MHATIAFRWGIHIRQFITLNIYKHGTCKGDSNPLRYERVDM